MVKCYLFFLLTGKKIVQKLSRYKQKGLCKSGTCACLRGQ